MPLTDQIFDFFERIPVDDPKHILEFGTNMGFSTSIQKEIYPKAMISTYDIMAWTLSGGLRQYGIDPSDIWTNKIYISDLFRLAYGPASIAVHVHSSEKVKEHYKPNHFDYALIDGDHTAIGALRDINNCIDLNIPILVIDNLEGKGVRQAVAAMSDRLDLIDEISYTQQKPTKEGKTHTAILHTYKVVA